MTVNYERSLPVSIMISRDSIFRTQSHGQPDGNKNRLGLNVSGVIYAKQISDFIDLLEFQ